MVDINIQKKDLWLLSSIVVFLVGVGFVIAIGSGDYNVHGHDGSEIEGGFGIGMGVLSPGDTIPLPAGVTNPSNCVWMVSINKLANSNSAPSMESTGVYVDTNRLIHHACEPSNCGDTYPNPRLVNYIIVCN